MYFLSRPTEELVRHFLAAQETAQFSYSAVGESRNGGSPAGFVVDHNRIQLGSGVETFEKAKKAIREWKMFAMPWVELCWPEAPIAKDGTVAILVSHCGFWSLNAAKIVYVIEEPGACTKYGFAYGTLTEHGESREERFMIEFHHDDASVWYDLLAFSRPNGVARIVYPLARALQKRFAADSKLAMKNAVK
jgi:uncharacterized protein (UPF0548 family)